MTLSRDTISAIRFGYGLSPSRPFGAAGLDRGAARADEAARRWPKPGIAARNAEAAAYVELRRTSKKEGTEAAKAAFAAYKKDLRNKRFDDLRAEFARAIYADDPFLERLSAFWLDHFAIAGRNVLHRHIMPAYSDEAIRPHLFGDFATLLKAAVLHPSMLVFLDQTASVGPNSPAGKRRGRGLNENLAREILELHSLGVGGAYSQTDVRELAELLTGLAYNPDRGFRFDGSMAEPGAETVLGARYGGAKARLEDIHDALDAISAHPDTATHIARKLAVHFIADDPPAVLVDAMAAEFSRTGGRLDAVYGAMIDHRAQWAAPLSKAKQPFDFLVSALRALDVSEAQFANAKLNQLRTLIIGPLQIMGQTYGRPGGPDGWPEDFAEWITPQGLAARIQWAMSAPATLLSAPPDPRDFVQAALADAASGKTRLAAEAAESKWEGVGLVLASPEFNLR